MIDPETDGGKKDLPHLIPTPLEPSRQREMEGNINEETHHVKIRNQEIAAYGFDLRNYCDHVLHSR